MSSLRRTKASCLRWREWCGLSVMRRWEDLVGVMGNNSVKGYSEMYESPEDIDLWTAGVSELPLPGSMVGPTFACIIGKQFHNFRFNTAITFVSELYIFGCRAVNILAPFRQVWRQILVRRLRLAVLFHHRAGSKSEKYVPIFPKLTFPDN